MRSKEHPTPTLTAFASTLPLQGRVKERPRMPTQQTISDFRRKTARRLRQSTTDGERRLWRALKVFELKGTHFRRQVPIGSYVADFACMAAKLVIEIDGS